jgi:co-chaperonin GroES (HSP10)
MAKSVLEPATDHVIVVDEPRSVTIGGIELPDNVKGLELFYGTVVFVGPAVNKIMTQVRDVVCYGPYAGKMAVINGTEFRILKESQIEAYVRPVEEETYPAGGSGTDLTE